MQMNKGSECSSCSLALCVILVLIQGVVGIMLNTTHSPNTFASADLHAAPSAGAIAKAVVSSKMRLIFIIGLEGTGHHYIVDALKHLFDKNRELPYFNLCPIARMTYLFNSMVQDPAHYVDTQEKIRAEMRTLAAAQHELAWPGTIATIQPTKPETQPGCRGIGVMSYPFNVGKNKVLQYPDVRTVAEAAEAEGVDLRVLYLKRPAEDFLVANTVHRKFHS